MSLGDTGVSRDDYCMSSFDADLSLSEFFLSVPARFLRVGKSFLPAVVRQPDPLCPLRPPFPPCPLPSSLHRLLSFRHCVRALRPDKTCLTSLGLAGTLLSPARRVASVLAFGVRLAVSPAFVPGS